MIHEYKCGKCGNVFTGDGEPTEIHLIDMEWGGNQDCGGVGVLVATYYSTLRLED